jgi:hypothetical protein
MLTNALLGESTTPCLTFRAKTVHITVVGKTVMVYISSVALENRGCYREGTYRPSAQSGDSM